MGSLLRSSAHTNMVTCTKRYADIPFAHRQHSHDGHCAQIHGHNWTFDLTFQADSLDENGFVVDFGKLKYLKEFFRVFFDHALVLNATDPRLDELKQALVGCADIVVVPSCSCEGLAEYVAEKVNQLVQQHTHGRVSVQRVVCWEDAKNSAEFCYR